MNVDTNVCQRAFPFNSALGGRQTATIDFIDKVYDYFIINKIICIFDEFEFQKSYVGVDKDVDRSLSVDQNRMYIRMGMKRESYLGKDLPLALDQSDMLFMKKQYAGRNTKFRFVTYCKCKKRGEMDGKVSGEPISGILKELESPEWDKVGYLGFGPMGCFPTKDSKDQLTVTLRFRFRMYVKLTFTGRNKSLI